MSKVRETILEALWNKLSDVSEFAEEEDEALATVKRLADAAEFMGISLRELMAKYGSNERMKELRNEAEGYDFSQGERGKYAKRLDPAEKTIGDLCDPPGPCLCGGCPVEDCAAKEAIGET